jgi:CMP-N-acetylneuraminic acid synthetase
LEELEKITAIIPARIGSKRLKGKNFLDFCGRPLAEWSIIVALKCKLIDKIIFSTDHESYDFKHPRVIIDHRDPEMCGYDVHTDDIYLYLKNKYKIEGSMIVLEPTSPIRTPEMLEKGIRIHLQEHKSVVSVYESNWNPNGVYYIFNGDNVYDNETIPIITSKESGVDIDHWHQFRIAEYIFANKPYKFMGLTYKELLNS